MAENSPSGDSSPGREAGAVDFQLGKALARRAHELIPGGAHTYAKGDDQFPLQAPSFIVRGKGCHVWDMDGNEFIEYGMGLRSVTLGHAYPSVIEAVARQLEFGTNFNRPAPIEVECAERFLQAVATAEMVKFCKNGSDALDGAVRLARAHTGREFIAVCADHPFFSTADWFIGTTPMAAGVPGWIQSRTVKFRYNDLASLQALFDEYPDQIACVILEPARLEEPAEDFLAGLQRLCLRNGAVLVFDEMITGFRWHRSGAQHVFGVTPDLSAFGKAFANGFALSALAGKRELMQLGGYEHDRERVFLLSTTHGAETHSLAAAIATMRVYEREPVTDHLHRQGQRLRVGVMQAVERLGLQGHFDCMGRDCCLLFSTNDAESRPSQAYRALFMQEMIRRGVLAPSFVVSYSHSDHDIDRTVDAVYQSLQVYRRALDEGVDRHLVGERVRPVFRSGR
jgi:glutamate-1-semialdehyde 2,1-aminomutase